jgi:hypothetical protein
MWRIGALIASLICLLTACRPALAPPTVTRTPLGVVVMAQTIASPTAIAVPTVSPTPTIIRVGDCPTAPRSRLILQERGRVTDENDDRLRIRSGPGIEYDQLILMNPRDLFFVLGGPTCADGYAWYRVRHGRIEGWVAEGDDEGYFAEPYLPG